MHTSEPSSPKLSWQLVDQYLAGEASEAEAARVEAWLQQSPDVRELIRQLKAIETMPCP